MSLSIQTNVNSLVAQENLRVNSDFQARTIQRLTSGYRINSSGDDAAGLAVANKFRSDTAELSQGVRNANDGLSSLQIIDGGMNNISKILDRMKTLATQSASSTFTGDRTTLSNEFNTLMNEVTRQASNVGMSASNQQFNTLINVYIGGGGTLQSNSQVTVDLSGSSNQIDAVGLGISGATIVAGGTALGSIDTRAAASSNNGYFLNNTGADGEQDFTVQTATGSTTVKVKATTNTGVTISDAVNQINNQLSGKGVTASIDSSTGYLQFSGSVAFSVLSSAVSGTGTAHAIATAATNIVNTGMNHAEGAASFTALGGVDHEDLTFTGNGRSVSLSLNVTNATSITVARDYLNQQLAGLGITAVVNNGGISFQSASAFTYQQTAATANGVFASGAIGQTNATAAATGGSLTGNALSALTMITTAVATLGQVQGKVGTGQNQLNYAINLAQSQISNFSAAESRIRDTDVAAEAANLTKASVTQQASMAAMAQANAAPQA
ncbi:MAG TPA: flagellin, partial [Bryobacteraceae bacterium]